MSSLSFRQKDIIKYLLSQEEHVSVKQISKLFNISEKTIYRDLDSIQDKVLKENMSIEKIPGKGIKIVGKAQDKMNVNLELRNNNEILEETSVQERRAKILLDLLEESPNFTSIDILSEKYYISRASIVNDISYLTKEINKYDLIIEKSNKGTRIVGSEKNIRDMMVHLINSSIHEKNLDKKHLFSERIEESTYKELEHMFGTERIQKVESLLYDTELALNYTIADSYYINIVTHLLIAIQRIENGNQVYEKRNDSGLVVDKNIYSISKKLGESLEVEFSIKLPKEEIFFIYQYLVSSGVGSILQTLNMPILLEKIDPIVRNIIEDINDSINNSLNINIDENSSLFDSLTLHIKAMLNRLSYKILIKNTLLDEIKKELFELFDLIGITLLLISGKYNLNNFSEDEIAYLAVYYQAILEEKTSIKNIIIVCSSGIGSSHLLKNRIKSVFPEWRIKDVISLETLKRNYNLEDVDLIISTIKITDVKKPIAYVSVLLDENDIAIINKYFFDIKEKENFKESHFNLSKYENSFIEVDFEKQKKYVSSLINEYSSKKDKILKFNTSNNIEIVEIHSKKLNEKIKVIYSKNEINKIILFKEKDEKYIDIDLIKFIFLLVKKKEFFEFKDLNKLSNLFSENHIILNSMSQTKEQLLQELSDELLKNKIIKSDEIFLEEISTRESLGPTYVAKEIALPHIISNNVLKDSIYIIRTQNIINWDEKNKINCIVVIVAKETKIKEKREELKAISKVVESLLDEDFRNILLNENKENIFTNIRKIIMG